MTVLFRYHQPATVAFTLNQYNASGPVVPRHLPGRGALAEARVVERLLVGERGAAR